MAEGSYLIVKLSAAGDVLLATALARELRRQRPRAHIAWLTSEYAAPLVEGNPDLDAVLTLPAGRGGGAAALALWQGLRRLRAWGRQQPEAVVLLAHRARRLSAGLRAAGLATIIGFDPGGGRGWGLTRAVPFPLGRHRLQLLADLLRAAGVEAASLARLVPRLDLSWNEFAAGEQVWQPDNYGPRWVLAPGGGANPWSAMPNRRWPRERFLELGQRAQAEGVELRLIGGREDAAEVEWICGRLAEGARCHWAGKLSLRHSAAAIAAADLVIGNDSLPLIMAHALARPSLGLYGPTSGAHIHAPGQKFLQGRAGCGPCYDPRQGRRGMAYVCPRARCMEQITVSEVWRAARAYLPHAAGAYAG